MSTVAKNPEVIQISAIAASAAIRLFQQVAPSLTSDEMVTLHNALKITTQYETT